MDYLDEDGIELEVIEPTQEAPKKQTQESYSHDKGETSGYKAKKYSIGQKSIWNKTTFKPFSLVDTSKLFSNA